MKYGKKGVIKVEIHARLDEYGNVIPLTEEDRIKFEVAFPDGEVHLNSDNCPELAAEIERQSAILLEQNRKAYEVLAHYD